MRHESYNFLQAVDGANPAEAVEQHSLEAASASRLVLVNGILSAQRCCTRVSYLLQLMLH